MDPRWQAVLQLVLGVGLILVGVLVDDVRKDQASFGMLIGLGSAMIGNVPKGPLEGRGSTPPPRG